MLRIYQPRGNIDKFAFAQRSIPQWNSLPSSIVEIDLMEQFKVLLEKHLQQNPLPSWHSSKPHAQSHLRDRLHIAL